MFQQTRKPAFAIAFVSGSYFVIHSIIRDIPVATKIIIGARIILKFSKTIIQITAVARSNIPVLMN
jgi:hypothetical protein